MKFRTSEENFQRIQSQLSQIISCTVKTIKNKANEVFFLAKFHRIG